MKIQLIKEGTGRWSWAIVARNGKRLCVSVETYLRRAHAERMARQVAGEDLEVVDVSA